METVKLNINGVIVDVDKAEVSKALETGEVEIKSDLIVLTPDIYAERERNIRNDEYAKTKEKASEIFNKEIKRQFNVEVEGKDTQRVIEGLRNKILEEAKIEPTKQIEDLKRDADMLRQNLIKKEEEFNTFQQVVTTREKQQKIENILISKMPKEGTLLSADKLVKMTVLDGYTFDIDETGNLIPMKNGEIIKNRQTLSPESAEKVIGEFIQPYLNLNKGGFGGQSTKGASQGSTLDDFNSEMESKGVAVNSIEYNREMGNRISNKTLVI